ncbi:unnamed protein product [Sordaria macrospora k-hell]|uniref:WGS project CABT00000000 data, contig 2.35 n=1 Tax=Sordaria macrospora (strain ATCC MYA-333 / DSM 997 / K(L3346) / K-hell) TaxID=771870 RepID=F7W6K1_SORMK|nr:uncharacterized protein SMAC_06358 [Sordaria macrospora k-hell]CCC13140.1 unnamed protein product [Sordaria macrospora k-hell]
MPTSISREGLTIDDVGRLIRRTVLNPYLTLPPRRRHRLFRETPRPLPGLPPAGTARAARDRPFLTLSHRHLPNRLWHRRRHSRRQRPAHPLVRQQLHLPGARRVDRLEQRNCAGHGRQQRYRAECHSGLAGAQPAHDGSDSRLCAAELDGSRECPKEHPLLPGGPDQVGRDPVRRRASEKEVGHPTVLINNAGIARGFTIMEGSYGDVESTLRTNLTAPFLLTKEFLPEMVRRNHGHIVNICSMSAFLPPPYIGDYAASKAGVQMLHESLQLELKHAHKAKRVRLTLAIPSFIQTPLIGASHPRQNNFIFPLLHVRTVSEEIVDSLYSGYGRTIYLPGIMRYLTSLRGAPEWVLRMARESTVKIPVDFKGRQVVDVETGGIKLEDHEA